MILVKGKTYECDLLLSGFLEKRASNSMVAGKLRGLGFVDVLVRGDGEHRIATGTWDLDDAEAPTDERVQNIREA